MIRSDVREGVTVRNSSTANLLIDSRDSITGLNYSANFTIQKKSSILNGFFSRLAVSEVVVQWNNYNISTASYGNGVLTVNIGGTDYTNAPLAPGNYTVAECLDALVIALNAAVGGAGTFSITQGRGFAFLTCTVAFTVEQSPLAEQLQLDVFNSLTSNPVIAPFLLPYHYIDFVSNELTYNQALKDATTSIIDRTVLYRWNFSWDDNSERDAYGYPIIQGYKKFRSRRDIAFPKQIRWENNMPIGQISFQVYDSNGNLIPASLAQFGKLEWGMTLLVSED
jgi:hypothetical protein